MNKNIESNAIEFWQRDFSDRPFVTFTPDRKVIVEGDVYVAAEVFWEAVRTVLPQSWTMEVRP